MPLPQLQAVALAPVTKISTEDRNYSIDLTALLPATDLLDPGQTPSIVQTVSPDSTLVIGTAAVNTSPFVNSQGGTCQANCGVIVRISGGTGLIPPQANYYLLRVSAKQVSGLTCSEDLPVYVQS
jgi:hypothetical protein